MNSILIIAGPSAVGKTTVMRRVLEREPRFEFIRSKTTRLPRGDGQDNEYIYTTREDFLNGIKTGEVLEYTEYADNYYGTPRSEIERIISSGKIPLLILDMNGVRTLKRQKHNFNVVSIYLWDNIKVLNGRLGERYSGSFDAQEKLVSRIAQNRADFKKLPKMAEYFDAFIHNSDLDSTASEIVSEFLRISAGGERDVDYINYVADLIYHFA